MFKEHNLLPAKVEEINDLDLECHASDSFLVSQASFKLFGIPPFLNRELQLSGIHISQIQETLASKEDMSLPGQLWAPKL